MMTGRRAHLWRRFAALDHGDRLLVVEAAVLTGLVHAGLRTLPFAWLRRLLDGAKRLRARSPHPQRRIAWAVQAAARLLPGRTCLIDALAADVMLCRRGYDCVLRVGVKKGNGPAPLEAHAWVECDGAVVAGGLATLDEYRRFPHLGGTK